MNNDTDETWYVRGDLGNYEAYFSMFNLTKVGAEGIPTFEVDQLFSRNSGKLEKVIM